MRRLALLFSLVLLAGCRKAEGPEEAYRRFAQATAKRDAATAWSLLSSESQQALTRAAADVAKAEGREAPKDGRQLLLSDATTLVAPPRDASAVFEGDRTFVVVRDEAGERGRVAMVKEDGRWRVDLSRELRPGS